MRSLSSGALGVAALLLAVPASAQRPSPLQPGLLRVCADPDNMPSSNDKGEGFENKLASMIAQEWKSELRYVWYPTRRGYFRILNGMYCDVAMEAPAGMDVAGSTKPYFRSAYVFVARQGSGLEDVKSLADPRLKKLKIGVNIYTSDAENSPPAMALARYGVVGNLTGFSTFFDDQNRPEDIVKAVAGKAVDIAIAWGPLAGYYAKSSPVPLVLNPLPERDSLSDTPFRYSIGLAVRRRDKELRDSLQTLLDRKAPEIQALLKQYNVPLFPIPEEKEGEKVTGSTPAAPADSTRVAGRR
ncbi:MAG TPA: quinoprotein dehydrogenase-associated putative ABC transporter substrate-binding protein [Gemmatimonadales bacterium]|jgi:quinoprotein dehydrogenase-associated probable ABC transporter substrate-binding protein|nr:quinoprotein dehydrogenase-associated putative ABC transporter substrate-binding protein [Gemmatimonadales bacterium]